MEVIKEIRPDIKERISKLHEEVGEELLNKLTEKLEKLIKNIRFIDEKEVNLDQEILELYKEHGENLLEVLISIAKSRKDDDEDFIKKMNDILELKQEFMASRLEVKKDLNKIIACRKKIQELDKLIEKVNIEKKLKTKKIFCAIKRAVELCGDKISFERCELSDLLGIDFDASEYSYDSSSLHNLRLLAQLIQIPRFNLENNERFLYAIFSVIAPLYIDNNFDDIRIFFDVLMSSDLIDFERPDLSGNTPVKFLLKEDNFNSMLFLSLRRYNFFSLNNDNCLLFNLKNFFDLESSTDLKNTNFSNICIKFLINNLKEHSPEQSIMLIEFFRKTIFKYDIYKPKMSIIAEYKKLFEDNGFPIKINPKDLILFALSIRCDEIIECFGEKFESEEQRDTFMYLLDGDREAIKDGIDLETPNDFGINPLEFALKIGTKKEMIDLLKTISYGSDIDIMKKAVRGEISRAINENNLEKIKDILESEKINFVDFDEFYPFGKNELTLLMHAVLSSNDELIKIILNTDRVDLRKKDLRSGLTAIKYMEYSIFSDDFMDFVNNKVREYYIREFHKGKDIIKKIIESQNEKRFSREEGDMPFSFRDRLMIAKSESGKKSLEI